MELEQILDSLDGVRRSGGQYQARCPSHDDRVQSLSVTEEDGRVLLYCHAGCETEDVLTAMGMEMSDLHNAQANAQETVYPYVDEEGKPLFEVVRTPPKKFRQRLPDGTWGIGSARRVLYNLPEVRDAIESRRWIFVVEGEKDADALRERGCVATTNPLGAGAWRDEYTEQLRGAHVLIVADQDEPGIKHAEKVKEALSGVALQARIVRPKSGKDAAEHLAKGHSHTDFLPQEGRKTKRTGIVVTAKEMADNALAALTVRPEDDIGYGNPWGYSDLDFRPGRLYVLGGYTGDGKSTVALQVFRYVSQAGHKCAFFSLEMTETDLRNRLLAQKAIPLTMLDYPSKIPKMWVGQYEEAAAEIGEWNSEIVFDTRARAHKVQDFQRDGEYDFIIFDHLHRVESDDGEAAIAREVRGFTNIALDYNVPVLLLSQLRRPLPGMGFPKPIITDFKGSGAIEQEASVALSIWRVRDAEGRHDFTGSTELAMLKNRHGPCRVYRQRFDPLTITYLDMEGKKTDEASGP